jgi:hypothetical protein
LFDQLADVRAGEPVIAVAAVPLDCQQAGIGQLGEVAACRRPADSGLVGEHAGRQRTTIVERQQHLAARRIGE